MPNLEHAMTRAQLITLIAPIAAKFIVDAVRTWLLPKCSRSVIQLLALVIGALSAALTQLATGAGFDALQIALLSFATLTVNELGKTVRDRASAAIEGAVPLLLCAALLAATGCASAPKQGYRALAITGASATQAMHAWRDYVNAGHATPDQVAAVKLAYIRYQAAYHVAVDALAIYTQAHEPGPWLAAKPQLDSALIDILHLIALYNPKVSQ
jgi:hypothetical protein